MAERAGTHSYCKKTPRFAEKGGADEAGHCIFAEAGHYNRRNGIKKGTVIQFLFRIHRYLFAGDLFVHIADVHINGVFGNTQMVCDGDNGILQIEDALLIQQGNDFLILIGGRNR